MVFILNMICQCQACPIAAERPGIQAPQLASWQPAEAKKQLECVSKMYRAMNSAFQERSIGGTLETNG